MVVPMTALAYSWVSGAKCNQGYLGLRGRRFASQKCVKVLSWVGRMSELAVEHHKLLSSRIVLGMA